MNKDNTIYLKLILDSIDKIKNYTKNFDIASFKKDEKTQSAVLMQFQIIGELSKKINEDIKNKLDLPWKEIAGFRDMISHDYFNVDVLLVWETINKDINVLEDKIKSYLK